jgi:hypothetical protein
LRRAGASAVPQTVRSCAWAGEPLFGRFSRPLLPFLRFNRSPNRVECAPSQKRRQLREEGRGKAARGQSADCGLGVDWRKKLRGKPPENRCVDHSSAWTICPSSTAAPARRPLKKRTVHNPSLLHSFSTASGVLSPRGAASQGLFLQRLAPEGGFVLPDKKAPLLL